MGYSKLKIPKVCEHCKKPFEAKTVLTRFCSRQCVNKADHARKMEAKEQAKSQSEKEQKTKVIADIQSRPYISIAEATLLFGISKDTLHRLIKRGHLPAHNFGERLTRISRVHLEALFVPIAIPEPIPEPPKVYKPEDCYTIGEVQKKFGISDKTLYLAIKRLNIDKIPIGKYVYVPKEQIDKVFAPTQSENP
ncbi:MAG: helix-turn-helix domain-containing protein [Paludibacter sp.]|jgi:excisionase family DNA binding protein|nr:helix-turn-helix domain-containing protein [Paludibacter sp.]